ncbi:methyltransferase N6AMT1-like [Diadema antillarum]|uniref:methyltransferase N6AMT1-like n=1 Tax=Diadema antillarum TaxID=105358 RepID=UPI003A899D91
MASKYELKTPDVSHLTTADFEKVYEPAEDSFLLLDCLQEEASFIRDLRPSICVEIGSGSGIVITALSQLLDNTALCVATDRNPHAAMCTQRTSRQNGCQIEVVTSDLLNPFQDRFCGAVDILIFNPPYVVTPSEEMTSSGIEASWAGGIDGREVTDRLLPLVASLLSPLGVMYLITIRENKPHELMKWVSNMGLESKVVLERRAGPEHLSVLKLFRAEIR